jgi:hypothetical protein
MPIYQYENGAGNLVELFRTIAERDQVPKGLKRVTVPARLAIFGTSNDPRDEHSADSAVPKAYQELEEQTGGTAFLKESGFTRDQVRRAWDF